MRLTILINKSIFGSFLVDTFVVIYSVFGF